jgi:hypothetical protein
MAIVVDSTISTKAYQRQLCESCVVAARLLLWPECVLSTTLYWVAQYNDYLHVEREEDCFNHFIRGLLRDKPALKLSASEHITHQECTRLSYAGLIQFIGTACHAIPLEYFARQYNTTLFQSLANLVSPEEKCFASRNMCGLEGELSLAEFRYDCVLEYFYEPSFIILTAYLIHLSVLLSLTPMTNNCLPRHFYSIRAINEEELKNASCLSDSVRLESMRSELRILYNILNQADLNKVMNQCQTLWEEKATYCYQQMFIRRDTVMKKYQ